MLNKKHLSSSLLCEVMVNGTECLLRIDAGGFIILQCGEEPRYFGCEEEDGCWRWFPSEFLCNEADLQ